MMTMMVFPMRDNTDFINSYSGKLLIQRVVLFWVKWERSMENIWIKDTNPSVFRSRPVITMKKLPGV